MALKIAATPVLEGEDALRFLKRLHEGGGMPVKQLDPKKIADVVERIRQRKRSRLTI